MRGNVVFATSGRRYVPVVRGYVEGRSVVNPDDAPAGVLYRVPPDSVSRTFCRLGLCGEWTVVQVLVALNVLCFATHLTFFIVTIASCKGKDLHVDVFRLRANWTSAAANGYSYDLVSNNQGFDIGTCTALWFGLTAGFHLLQIVLGLAGEGTRWWYFYARQLDDAFPWWRWCEYSLTASFMVLGLAIVIGIREELVLTCLFVLTWIVMVLGLTTELYSRPKSFPDETSYTKAFLGRPTDHQKGVDKLDYFSLKLIGKEGWVGDRTQYRSTKYTKAQRLFNFSRRIYPHVLGYVPFVVVWACILKFFFTSVEDVRELRGDPDANMPSWVALALGGTLILYFSFAPVQFLFQLLPPSCYFASEMMYLALSLVSKTYLGIFLLLNVILAEDLTEVAGELSP